MHLRDSNNKKNILIWACSQQDLRQDWPLGPCFEENTQGACATFSLRGPSPGAEAVERRLGVRACPGGKSTGRAGEAALDGRWAAAEQAAPGNVDLLHAPFGRLRLAHRLGVRARRARLLRPRRQHPPREHLDAHHSGVQRRGRASSAVVPRHGSLLRHR